MISTVFFDLYGTLATFEPSRYDVQSRACAEVGIEVSRDGITRGYVAADAYMAQQTAILPLRSRDAESKAVYFAEYEKLVLEGDGVEVTPEQAMDIWRRIRQIPYDLAPFDDVAPALGRLKSRGLTLGLITNLDRDGDELTESLGLAPYLDLAVTSSEVGTEKPHPRIFEAALSKARAQPKDAMHVGDQPTSDVEGALGVGINPVLLDRDGNYRGFAQCPRIETLTELPGLLASFTPS